MNTDTQWLAPAKNAMAYFFPEISLLTIKAYGSGHIHRTFWCQLSNGCQYLLQRINTTIFTNPMLINQNIDHLTRHLKKSNYPFEIATLIASPNGNLLYEDQEKSSWRAFTYLHPTRSYDQVEHPEQAYAAAKAFGIFLKQISTIPPSLIQASIPDFHNCQFRQKQFQSVVQNDLCNRLQYVREEVTFLQQHSYCKEWQSRKLPLKLSHNDTKINNILFQEDGLTPVAIIDLDTVMLASPLYDFGDMVRTFTNAALEDDPANKVEMRISIFEALCKGFAEATEDLLEPSERSALLLSVMLIVQVQAQRFLNDYLNGDVYYPIQYPDHNLVRARNQLALLKSILVQQKEMEMIIRENFFLN